MIKSRTLTALTIAAAVAATGAAVRAQDGRTRTEQRIVIPHEIIAEIQRVIRDAVDADITRDLNRSLNTAMRNLSRELSEIRRYEGLPTVVQDRDFRAEQTDRQTRTLAIGANGALELKNVVGDITVKTGGGREATVEIVRVSRGRTDADARVGLERVTTEVTIRGTRGSVQVRYPDERRPAYSVSVAYNVTTPAGTALAIHTITGDVSVTGVKGEVRANSVSGGIRISAAGPVPTAHTLTGVLTLTDVESDGTIDAGTVSGEVRLSNIRARRLTATAVAGDVVANNITVSGAELSTMSGELEYTGSIAQNGRYEFQSHSGEIRLGLSGGFDFEGRAFSGSIEADAELGLTRPAGRRQTLRGTVGGGGGFVEATTFSGSVRLSRKLK